jgi:hypothetical protein
MASGSGAGGPDVTRASKDEGRQIDYFRTTVCAGIETGNLAFASYGKHQIISGLLLRNDPLDEVWRESEAAWHLVREARYGDILDIIGSQQRFIATMQGETANLSAYSDAHFDEAKFESELSGAKLPLMICWYWILKLKARFLSGDFAEALDAAEKAQSLLSTSTAHIQLLDYFFYDALTVAVCYENASADHRLLMPDGRVKYLHALAPALKTSSGNLEYVGAVTDVTAAKQAEHKWRRGITRRAELTESPMRICAMRGI